MENEYEPDCFDLNDWCVLTQPDFYKAVKYLQPSIQYDLIRKFWIECGKPEIPSVIQ